MMTNRESELRVTALHLAVDKAPPMEQSPSQIVARAEEFYAFLTGVADKEPATNEG